jgi:hypothetical protein
MLSISARAELPTTTNVRLGAATSTSLASDSLTDLASSVPAIGETSNLDTSWAGFVQTTTAESVAAPTMSVTGFVTGGQLTTTSDPGSFQIERIGGEEKPLASGGYVSPGVVGSGGVTLQSFTNAPLPAAAWLAAAGLGLVALVRRRLS